MKKKLLLLFTLFVTYFQLQAQKETDNWFFGVSAGLDFTSGTPVQQAGAVYSISEGCASMSTPGGTLLFYTDGSQVWNANHVLMPNGTDLYGDISSSQSSIIVPNPSNTNQYYIFTTDADGDTAGFRYSMVDMTLQSGLGDITIVKNIFVEDSVTEKLAAIKTNTGSYWILTHKWNTDAFYAYQLTGSGLQPPVISHTGLVHNDSTFQNTYGQLKFNMCGTKLALAIGYMNTAQLFDFNLNSGVVSNPVTLPVDDHVYGIEFSPNSNLLYVSTYDNAGSLLQYNVSLPSPALIQASKTPLTGVSGLYALQIATDGKIYVAKSFSSSYVGVINSPNTVGLGCNYVDNGIYLDSASMGNTCALGLPGFMQTYFKTSLSITCAGMGIEDNWGDGIGIYPNPTADEFYMDLSSIPGKVEITVVDYAGRMIEKQVSTTPDVYFGSQYIPGIYFAIIRFDGASKVFKLIKR